MYSAEGGRLINQVLAGRESVIGTHIIMGLNVVYDATINGASDPYTHNRYHTPYIVDEIPIANSSVITADTPGDRDRIVFSGQSDANKRYIANNMGLAVIRGGGTRVHKTIANVANGVNWSDYTAVTPTATFTNDGVLSIGGGDTARYINRISLVGYGADDILAFPLSWHGTPPPSGTTVTLGIQYRWNDESFGGEEATASSELLNSFGTYRFDFETSNNNDVTTLGTDDAPTPFIFQCRLGYLDGWGMMTPYLRNISQINISLNGAGPDTIMRFGSLKITPDFESDTSRTTTAFRKLNSTVYKTDLEAYVNPEFTLLGVV